MAQVTGSNCKLVYDVESTFGTTPGTPNATVIPFKSEGFSADIEQLSSDVITGNRNATAAFTGNTSVKGSISTELDPYMGTLLKHLVGSVTTSGASAPYTHVLKVGSLPTSLCFEKQFTDLTQYFLYNGCRINKGSFDFKPAGVIDTSFDIVGQKRTISGTPIDATATDAGHTPFEGFQAAILEGGSAIATVTACKIDIENDIQSDLYTIGGGGLVSSLPEGMSKVTGSLTAVFDSMTLLNKAINSTESSLKITLAQGTGAGTAGNESIEFFIPELKFKASDPTIKDAKGIMIELPFTAYYTNSTEASSIQITLKNTSATI